jgi:hypothetical protein
MIGLIVATGILLWYALAFWAVKHEEELREIWEMSKEIVERWFGEEEEKEG